MTMSDDEAGITVMELLLDGRRCWCIAASVLPPRVAPQLSTAERDVCRMLLSGLATADVARRRGTSSRTVANQCASIYRKLAVCSRGELNAKLARQSQRLAHV
jgi:DNA-binding CsgD family transcriptional regulator